MMHFRYAGAPADTAAGWKGVGEAAQIAQRCFVAATSSSVRQVSKDPPLQVGWGFPHGSFGAQLPCMGPEGVQRDAVLG